MKKFIIYISILICLPTIWSCERQIEPADLDANEYLKVLMEDWYLWYDKLPNTIIASAFNDPYTMIDVLRHDPPDRWSRVTTEEAYNDLFKASQFIGIGFLPRFDAQDKLRVAQVYAGSPGELAGMRRGQEIVAIGGTPVPQITDFSDVYGPREVGAQITIRIKEADGTEKDLNVVKDVVSQNSVIHSSVLDVAGKQVGYLVFDRFVEKSINELTNTFSDFKSAGVQELILDLRYNGGGLVSTALHLAGLVAPSSAAGRPFVKFAYNDKRADENDSEFAVELKSFKLELDRIIILTLDGTASASELILNGLKPYMEVVAIGQTTAGKPVGANTWFHKGYAFSPITFRYANANGDGDFYDGIVPNTIKNDGLDKDFGDPEEYMLSEAIYYIENGSFTGNPGGRVGLPQLKKQPISYMKGFEAEIGRW